SSLTHFFQRGRESCRGTALAGVPVRAPPSSESVEIDYIARGGEGKGAGFRGCRDVAGGIPMPKFAVRGKFRGRSAACAAVTERGRATRRNLRNTQGTQIHTRR